MEIPMVGTRHGLDAAVVASPVLYELAEFCRVRRSTGGAYAPSKPIVETELPAETLSDGAGTGIYARAIRVAAGSSAK